MENNNKTKTKNIKLLQIGVVLSCGVLFLIAFAVDNIHAEFINCPVGIDLSKYPICEFQDKWNESEEFNSLVVEKVGAMADQINNMAKYTDTIVKTTLDLDSDTIEYLKATSLMAEFSDAREQVELEYPGLFEKSTALKAEICTDTGICR